MNEAPTGSVSPEQARADRLYPSTAQSTPQAAPATSAQVPHADELGAARMYAQPTPPKPETGLPPEVAAIRNEPSRRMYDAEKTYAGSGIKTLFEGQGAAPDEVRAWSAVLADNEASADEAAALVGLVRIVRAEEPTEETVTAWGKDSIEQLQRKHGPRADALLADARRLVARDPRVSDFLLQSGLGSHPRVVSMFIEKAASLRAAGRFK